MPSIELSELTSFFGVGQADAAGRKPVAELIRAHGYEALGKMYAQASANRHTRDHFPGGSGMERAKDLQLKHWLALFDHGVSAEYHQSAERIGQVHSRIGLEPAWYIGGYSIVLEGLLSGLLRNPLSLLNPRRIARTIRTLLRHALFDMSVALGAYFEAEADKRDKVVTQLGTAMKELAAGNFSIELEKLPEEFSELEGDFVRMRDSVGELLTNLAMSSHSVRVCSTEIRNASDDLSTRNERQAAAIDEITRDAANGGEVAGQAAESMSAISEASAKVSQFSDAIDNIAFQTNLLALNAGVEAARAGDAGKGFAVVASEVRALSQRAADTAREIKTLSTLNAQRISEGAQRVQSMGELLRSIAQRIEESNRMIQANAALSEETNAATRSLVEQADLLDQLVSHFQTSGAPSGGAPMPRPANVTTLPAAPVSAAAQSARPAPPAPMPLTVGAAAVDMADWSEF